MEFDDEAEHRRLFRVETNSPQMKAVFSLEQGGSLSAKTPKNTVIQSFKIVILSNKLNLLLPFGPIAILVHYLTDNKGWFFLLSLLGITPLAERLGYATEQLACYTGPTVGGLLNATFGNVTELIISIIALKNGMIRVVQLTLLGSILSNMLLVLGCSFFCGGFVFSRKQQVFDKGNAVLNSGMLLIAVMSLLFPTLLYYTHSEVRAGSSELALSRSTSCIMLVAYAAYLFFQLKSQPSFLTEGASVSWKMPISFISVIVLPIVGNAAEHAGAIMFAMKDKLDLSLGVAIGSSIQISMFAVPFCVVISWMMGGQMDLNFQLFETATLFITVIVVAFFLQEGTSNYFKGLMLILSYLIVAVSFFVHQDPNQG